MLVRHPKQPGCSQWQCGGTWVSPRCVPGAVGTAPGRPSPSSALVAGNVRGPSQSVLLRQENKTRSVVGKAAEARPGGVRERANAASSPGPVTGLVAIKMGGCHGDSPLPLGPPPSRSVEARGARAGCRGGPGHRPSPAFGRGGSHLFIYICIKETLLKIEPSKIVNALPLFSRSAGS